MHDTEKHILFDIVIRDKNVCYAMYSTLKQSLVRCSYFNYFRTSFGAKFEHLLSSRAEIISRMHKPPPAEGNNLEELLGEEPIPSLPVPKPNNPVWPDEDAAAFCALTPPLETFMVVPDDTRKDQFYRVNHTLPFLFLSLACFVYNPSY